MSVSAVLLAAGRGQRMGQGNKVFLTIAGTTILARAAATLCRSPRIDELIVVARPSELALAAECLPPLDIPVRVVAGGAERQDSALAGVAIAVGDIVLVHDAARPFASLELVERVIDGTHRYGACIPVIGVVDTLRRVGTDGVVTQEMIDRIGLVCVQTPQGFRTEELRAALGGQRAHGPWSDDAAAVLSMGSLVGTVAGDTWNIKITTPADLDCAGRMAACLEQA